MLTSHHYQIFDYKQLSEGLQRQAQGYMKILNTVRYPNDYFFVGFYGQGFPAFLRNKRFIYCAKELARCVQYSDYTEKYEKKKKKRNSQNRDQLQRKSNGS